MWSPPPATHRKTDGLVATTAKRSGQKHRMQWSIAVEPLYVGHIQNVSCIADMLLSSWNNTNVFLWLIQSLASWGSKDSHELSFPDTKHTFPASHFLLITSPLSCSFHQALVLKTEWHQIAKFVAKAGGVALKHYALNISKSCGIERSVMTLRWSNGSIATWFFRWLYNRLTKK